MRSLRTRIMVLSAVMALGSAIACAVAAMLVAQHNLETMEGRQAQEALASLRKRVAQTLDGLTFEVSDYANWDELYQQMPLPDPAWAAINLTPGKVRGAVTQYMAVAYDGRIVGRYRDGDVRTAQSSLDDPASDAALAHLIDGLTGPRSGVAVFAGTPAFYAASPIRRSDRAGEPRGHLIALAYLDDDLRVRLQTDTWTVRIEVQDLRSSPLSAALPSWQEPVIRRSDEALSVIVPLLTHDGTLRLVLSSSRAAGQRIAERTTIAILLTGLVVAIAAMLAGTWLGWRWVQPISALAAACQRDTSVDAHWLPKASGLTEADVLSESLHHLVLRLRLGQDDLAQALDRESAMNAVHRRFLAQLGQEFGQPVRRLIALCERLTSRGGRLEPEELVAAQALADELEARFQEILGLAEIPAGDHVPVRQVVLDHYLNGIAELLRPQAERAGMTIRVDAPPRATTVDQALLTPVLVNLGANAIRAGGRGGTLVLGATVDDTRSGTNWTVSDDGPGLAEDLSERLRDAFARGEVMPGTPGIGMGLTLVVANVRALGGRLQLANRSTPGVTVLIQVPPPSGTPSGGTASERIRRRRG